MGTRDCLMRRASGTKPIARFREGVVPAALQDLHHRLLDHSIQHRRDDRFIMHPPLIALRIRHGFGLKYARALEAFARLFY